MLLGQLDGLVRHACRVLMEYISVSATLREGLMWMCAAVERRRECVVVCSKDRVVLWLLVVWQLREGCGLAWRGLLGSSGNGFT